MWQPRGGETAGTRRSPGRPPTRHPQAARVWAACPRRGGSPGVGGRGPQGPGSPGSRRPASLGCSPPPEAHTSLLSPTRQPQAPPRPDSVSPRLLGGPREHRLTGWGRRPGLREAGLPRALHRSGSGSGSGGAREEEAPPLPARGRPRGERARGGAGVGVAEKAPPTPPGLRGRF